MARISTEHGKKLNFADLVTYQLTLDDIDEGIRTVARSESVGAVIIS